MVDIPDEWMENMKHGRCWCGVDHTKFDKGQKYYCTKAHADEYSKRITYWSDFKDEILERDNHTCTKCGMNEEKFDAKELQREREFHLQIAKQYPNAIKLGRAILLKNLQQEYEKIMDDAYVADNLPYQVKDDQQIEWKITHFDKQHFYEEVDHEIPVALGGPMWDPENLHTMCYDCHKEKTKEDMIKIRARKANEKSR